MPMDYATIKAKAAALKAAATKKAAEVPKAATVTATAIPKAATQQNQSSNALASALKGNTNVDPTVVAAAIYPSTVPISIKPVVDNKSQTYEAAVNKTPVVSSLRAATNQTNTENPIIQAVQSNSLAVAGLAVDNAIIANITTALQDSVVEALDKLREFAKDIVDKTNIDITNIPENSSHSEHPNLNNLVEKMTDVKNNLNINVADKTKSIMEEVVKVKNVETIGKITNLIEINNSIKENEIQANNNLKNLAIPKIEFVKNEYSVSIGGVTKFSHSIVINISKNDFIENDIKYVQIYFSKSKNDFSRSQKTLSIYAMNEISNDKNKLEIIRDRIIDNNIKNTFSENYITNKSNPSIIFSPGVFSNIDNSLNVAYSNTTEVDKSVDDNKQFLIKKDLVGKLKNISSEIKIAKDDFNDSNFDKNIFLNENILKTFSMLFELKVDSSKFLERGEFLELAVVNEKVDYGDAVNYFAILVGANGIKSMRSNIVYVKTEKLIPPKKPNDFFTSINARGILISILSQDSEPEKFEIYRKQLNSLINVDDSKTINVFNSNNGLFCSSDSRKLLKNEFVQVGEVINPRKTSATFVDRDVLSGKTYKYRVYSVDIFGNKSVDPLEFDVFYSFMLKKGKNSLSKTSISVDVDQKTKKIKVLLINDDKRITSLRLERRNLTLNQTLFTVPQFPGRLDLKPKNRGEPYSNENKLIWNGVIEKNKIEKNKIEFIDIDSKIDNIYEYRVYGLDKFGNKSDYTISKKISIYNDYIPDFPINLSMKFVSLNPFKIKIKADIGNVETTIDDLFKNKDLIKNEPVKNLFQFQRREQFSEIWESFPVTEKNEIEDSVIVESKNRTSYEPGFLVQGKKYFYRVATIYENKFISNFSKHITIDTGAPLYAPENLKITMINKKVEPFFIVLNWDTNINSRVVDKWIIERGIANNIFSRSMNLNSVSDMLNVKFDVLAIVHLESSRARERSLDEDEKNSIDKKNIFIGQHYYMDNDVMFGNTYFYKIKAVDVSGENESSYSTKAIVLTDDIFNEKINMMLSREKMNDLSKSPIPIITDIRNVDSKYAKTNKNIKDYLIASYTKNTFTFKN